MGGCKEQECPIPNSPQVGMGIGMKVARVGWLGWVGWAGGVGRRGGCVCACVGGWVGWEGWVGGWVG